MGSRRRGSRGDAAGARSLEDGEFGRIQQARARFEDQAANEASLWSLGEELTASAFRVPHPGLDIARARVAAVTQLLDAGLRVPGSQDDVSHLRGLAMVAASDVSVLETERLSMKVADRLALDAETLSLVTSVLLIGRLAPVVPEDWRLRLAASAWQLVVAAAGNVFPASGTYRLFTVQVSADALEAALLADGTEIFRKIRGCRSDDELPTGWLLRRARSAATTPPAPSWEVASLTTTSMLLEALALEAGGSSPQELPPLSSADRDRYRQGKGLVAAHRRAVSWDRSRLQTLPAVIVSIGLLVVAVPVLLAGLTQGATPDFGVLRAIGNSLPIGDALNTNLQLLATAATLTIALAVARRAAEPDEFAAVNAFWWVGTVVVFVCGAVGTIIGIFVIFAEDTRRNGSYAEASLVLLLGLLAVFLTVGAGELRTDRRLTGARTAYEIAALEQSLARSRSADPQVWSGTSTAADRRAAAIYAIALPGASGCALLLTLVLKWQPSAVGVLKLFIGVAAFVLFAAAPTLLTIDWAAKVYAYRFRSDLTRARRRSRFVYETTFLVLVSVAALLLWALVGFGLSQNHGWWLASAGWAATFGPVGLLVYSTRHLRWPHFPRRLARAREEQRRDRLYRPLT